MLDNGYVISVHADCAKFLYQTYSLFEIQLEKLILHASPWWGRFYERLVRAVKVSLKKILGKSMLGYEELETVLLKIE